MTRVVKEPPRLHPAEIVSAIDYQTIALNNIK